MATDNPLASSDNQSDVAAQVIRDKVARLYDAEPNAGIEEQEAEAARHRSKHQQFMFDLSHSGKDLATVQTEWHNYYLALPEAEKHVVWQEFYASQSAVTQPQQSVVAAAHAEAEHKHDVAKKPRQKVRKPRSSRDLRSPSAIKATIRDTVSGGGKLTAKHHLQSLLFGLGMGSLAILIVLFGLFNQVVIAPLIQPSRKAASTPLIITSTSVAPSKTPEVIIPKINVEIPVIYDATSTVEADIQNNLEDGVVHYPTTAAPGQNGNVALFGHSSNNILNPGKYKFAFVLLHTIVPGDTFYLTYNSKVYVYKVISKTVVDPSEVGVLGPVPGQTATATLITCDPPGTSLKRLVVVGQQISPAVETNDTTAVTTTASAASTSVSLPGNGPTLFSRILADGIGKAGLVAAVVITIGLVRLWLRWYRRTD
ncbi:MAG: class E sortase [Candidatus Saccharimonadales bacterium]